MTGLEPVRKDLETVKGRDHFVKKTTQGITPEMKTNGLLENQRHN